MRAKRRAQIIAVATGSMYALVVFGIAVYPSSPLNALFTSTNSEVIASPNDGKRSVTIGALLPLTGAWSSVGESEDAAEKIAIKDVNQYFSKSNSNLRIGLVVEDTRTDPATSLEKLHDLAAKGVRRVIGPATSGLVKNHTNMLGYVYTLLHFLGSYMLKNYQVMLDFLSLLNPVLLCY